MTQPDKCRRLADAIRSCLEDGITIDEHALCYMDACLPGTSIETLAHGICETPDLNIASLMDLIFFPNESLQIQLEPIFETETYDSEDEAKIVSLLASEVIQTTLHVPEEFRVVPVQVPVSVLVQFVHRLGIIRRIPTALAATISSLHPPDTAARLKVQIRNARLSLTEAATSFLKLFFIGIDPEDPEYDACLESILKLFGEQTSETAPFRRIRSKIDSLYRAREATLTFEKQLRVHNMETLMQMGARAPETGSEAAEREIELLEKIGEAVALGGIIDRRPG